MYVNDYNPRESEFILKDRLYVCVYVCIYILYIIMHRFLATWEF